jgi:ABC-type transporter Mla subunit MlaD
MELSTFQGINYGILFLVIATCYFLYNSKKEDPSGLKSLPSIFTILGVFGTFTGISLGLFYFDSDPNEIANSVSFLLAGMQTAFLSSVAGMAFAVFVRITNVVRGNKEDNLEDAEKVITYLKRQNTSLKAIKEGIIGEDEGSLSNHLKLLRLDFSDFAKHQSQINMDALVKVMNKVIEDFNQQMQEQFGQNFKELNKAVEKLVDWQDNYYKQIEYMVNTIEGTNEAVDNSKKIIEDISKKYADTYQLTEDFKLAIDTMNNENKLLMENIENFSKLANDAKEAMPQIEKQLMELTKGFSSTVEKSLTDIKSSSEQITKSSEKVNEEIEKTIKSSSEKVNNQLTDLYKNSFDTLKQLQNKMSDDLNKNINDIDNQIGSVLQNSMNSLSSNLVTLSGKFVEDYAPLTEKLREIIRLAEEIEYARSVEEVDSE